ncbi:LysE family translocator [Sulfitobacter mediterraneus]|uniref:LysE family translocator n=1 Tax=Sulfitobacter mediterraneus TaxID=83219 RepID=UPI001939E74F|nr:LysE family translocator [Sulfitobacter mediterraneus]MBM1555971.1 LysE family translocator [Sulfitobacter mediterraneus]MBM1567991.1 LysE family translocator [Sulfitobacter mediterraneus]MBM1571325.1 LysE family translocator [Sulfitobacter mediterraneus]MBM1575113.1 LysE family translocator [Sulfitobacter mediterraneus]MBM1579396.1 LysE family translocator [Sulfitobacter mediterraneus]
MIDLLTLAAFVPASLALNLTPGADMMFCLGQGLRSGPRAAVAASAGISAGSMVHVLLAGLGLGAVIAAVPWAFDAIRWAGVAYLLFLAVQSLRSQSGAQHKAAALRPARAFATGFIVNLTNPKLIFFVLAFLPQFVKPEAGSVLLQFLIFGSIIGLFGFFINAAVGVFAGGVGRRVASGSRALSWITCGIFVALAARLALMERT